MADRARRHPENVPGPWFVDESCIDCDASRQCAPSIFGIAGDGRSVVVRQPSTDDERRAAARAMLVCPTASIGVDGERPDTDGLMPMEVGPGVYLTGYNSPRAYGANSYLALTRSGNVLVDAPRFVPALARRIEELGGIARILLTHRDDVGDADRWAARFSARVYIHQHDRSVAPFATDILRGDAPIAITDDVVAIPLPGHTRGSVAFLVNQEELFSGDSLYFSRTLGSLAAFRDQCWYSWAEQTRSLARLAAEHRFARLYPGHGSRTAGDPDALAAELALLVEKMRRDDAVLHPGGAGVLW
jgi:glyoxylase-like metal-dependent hydrolase (beta-lactamase superfamily II)/ferredoxin